MSRRYKSMRTYVNARKRREYNRYKKAFQLMQKKLEDKGSGMYDSNMYSYQEYYAIKKKAIEDFRAERGLSSKTKITIPNYLRDVVYSQAYFRDFDEVRRAKAQIRENIKQTQQEILLGEEEITVKGEVKTVALTKETLKEKEQTLKWLKEAEKYSIQQIRSGKQSFLDLLRDVNNSLKDDRKMINSYDRRAWIRREFFGYAS